MSNTTQQPRLPGYARTMMSKSRGIIQAVRWNTPNAQGHPLIWAAWKESETLGGLVCVTTYNDLVNLISTSGCSAAEPYWDWSVMGIIWLPNGKLVVCPGDWIVQDEAGVISVYTHEQFVMIVDKP